MKKRRGKNTPRDTISLRLTNSERLLILDNVLGCDEILDKMRIAVLEGDRAIFRFSPDELEELAEGVAAAANHAENENLERKLDRICDRIEDLLDIYDVVEKQNDPPDAVPVEPNSGLESFVQDLLERKSINGIEETTDFFLVAFYDGKKRSELETGDLSPIEMSRLIYGNWDDENAAICLRSDLAPADLERARLFVNARIFLNAALESDGIKATANGNLNRKFVTRMVSELDWPPGHVDCLWACNKVLNEFDVGLLHTLRVILMLAGLLRKVKGMFKITVKGKKLLDERKAGELYVLLFKTYFRKFNLSYMDGMPENPELQYGIVFSFYMLARHGNDWIDEDKLAFLLLLPTAKNRAVQAVRSLSYDMLGHLVQLRILRPLESLGLLELRELKKEGEIREFVEVRKTKLFDMVLKFNLSGS